MELPSQLQRHLEAARGFLDLGMAAEARAELADIPPVWRHRTEVIVARMEVAMRADAHGEALGLAMTLCGAQTDLPQAFIYRSFCLHALGRTEEARAQLLAAPMFMRDLPLFHYNLACYEARTGHLGSARRELQIAFSMDNELRETADEDDDLRELWPELDSLFRASANVSYRPLNPHELRALSTAVETGNEIERLDALKRLIEGGAETTLANLLQSADLAVSRLAEQGLWSCWLNEHGPEARELIAQGSAAMQAGDHTGAEALFDAAIAAYPYWAEAKNQRATVLYLQGRLRESLALCREVVKAKPHHLRAWTGMAMVAMQLEDWPTALEAALQVIRLQASAPENLRLLAQIEAKIQEKE